MNSREACKEKPLVLPVVAAPGGDQCCRQPMLSLPQSVGGCLGLGMGSCRLLPSAGWVRTCSSASSEMFPQEGVLEGRVLIIQFHQLGKLNFE